MISSNSPFTLQYQLRTELYEKIESGEWPDGFKIPGEFELCEQYGVSRITVREVLKELARNHYLIRKQGKGTFVSIPSTEESLISPYSLTEGMKMVGKTLSFRFLHLNKTEATQSTTEMFNLSDSDRVFEIIRLREVDGSVFAWEKSIVPEKYLKGITKKEIVEEGLMPSIRKRTGLYSVETQDTIEAVICADQVAKVMGIPLKTAAFKVKRKNLSQDGYIEKCESFVVGQRLNVNRQVKRK